MGRAADKVQGGRKVKARKKFFFEKKNQKTFAPETEVLETPMAPGQKFFAELFFKKATTFL
jgi:hypothetical protein